MRRLLLVLASLALLTTVIAAPAAAHDDGSQFPTLTYPENLQGLLEVESQALPSASTTACVDGTAAGFACSNIDLHAFLSLADMGGGTGNDIWGWTDPDTGKEYALMGKNTGTAFVDISDPSNPVWLGDLPTATVSSSWHDIKEANNHAYIVSEASGHGMQVFDLTRLRGVTSPQTWTADTDYTAFGNAHNIVVTVGADTAIAVGTSTCAGGLHIIDIATPASPVFAGCYSGDGYTHDAWCVIYDGPDTDHTGKELCIASNEDTVAIVDISDPGSPVELSNTGYRRAGYTHQAVFDEDMRYILLDDELDEANRGINTTTYVWDGIDLDAPLLVGTHAGTTAAIDHNQYVLGDYTYQANYRAGLRILELTDLAAADLTEVGYFDVYGGSDAAAFNGAWSVYPYFESGNVIVSGIEQGLFVLDPNLDGDPPPPPPPPPGDGVHVGDLDGETAAGTRGRWTATITITIHDGDDNPVAGETVTGNWGPGRSVSCVTTADGTCSIFNGRLRSLNSTATFTVTDVSGDYDPAANHDPDGDSDGTTITVTQP